MRCFRNCTSVLLFWAQERTNKDIIEATRVVVDELALGSFLVKYCLLKKRVLPFTDWVDEAGLNPQWVLSKRDEVKQSLKLNKSLTVEYRGHASLLADV